MGQLNILEMMGTLVGLIYLWLELKASIYLWIAGVIMPAIYIVVYYQAGLYADFGINIYYLVVAAYGWVMWSRGKKNGEAVKAEKKELPITHLPGRYYLPVTVASIALLVLIAYILITFTDSNVPWLDSFTTALSVIGLWMLARKYVEQWLVWIAVDAVCFGLYIYKGLYFTSALYGFYTVIAVYGYRKWLGMMQTTQKNN